MCHLRAVIARTFGLQKKDLGVKVYFLEFRVSGFKVTVRHRLGSWGPRFGVRMSSLPCMTKPNPKPLNPKP